jgi:ring-1,2-phenylacetyl-CoA epoxidase subunit PaaD
VNRVAPTREEIFELLDLVKDPEVPVLSVVELGIVRDVRVAEEEGTGVTVVITPTYSGCPAMRVIERDITHALEERGISPVRIETVYAPAWTTDWLTDAAKQKLEAYGIAPPSARDVEDELVPMRRRSPTLRCPLCGSSSTTITSEFGSTACKSIAHCNGCGQPFEQFKAI